MDKRPYGGWGSFYYLEQHGKMKKALERPRRERLAARTALEKIGRRYREVVPFFNPLHKGFRENEDGTIQWLDFCLQLPNRKLAVLLFDIRYPGHGAKPHERRSFLNKQEFLKSKKIPFLILKRTYTSMEMEILIRRFMQKER